VVVQPYNLSYSGREDRRIAVQVSPSQRTGLNLKSKVERPGIMAQVVEHLFSKYKTLNLISSTTKSKRKVFRPELVLCQYCERRRS
jgi:hypothetical protein